MSPTCSIVFEKTVNNKNNFPKKRLLFRTKKSTKQGKRRDSKSSCTDSITGRVSEHRPKTVKKLQNRRYTDKKEKQIFLIYKEIQRSTCKVIYSTYD